MGAAYEYIKRGEAMNRSLFMVLLITALLAAAPRAFSIEEHERDLVTVGVLPPGFREADARLAPVSATLHDTLELALRLLPGYDAVRLGSQDIADVDETSAVLTEELTEQQQTAEDLATNRGFGLVVFGRLETVDAEGYEITLRVYETRADEVVLELQRRTATLIDLFTVVDHLSTEIAAAVLGEPAGFGTPAFAPQGYEHAYRVELEGGTIPDSPSEVSPVLAGHQRVRVVAEPEEAEPFTVLDRELELRADETHTMRFGIPAYSPAERLSFHETEANALRTRMNGDRTPAEGVTSERQAELSAPIRENVSYPSWSNYQAVDELGPPPAETEAVAELRAATAARYSDRAVVRIGRRYLSYPDPEITGSAFFSMSGTILGESVEVETDAPIVQARNHERELSVSGSSDYAFDSMMQDGIEFRRFDRIGGPGRYRFRYESGGEDVFGVWSPRIIEPRYGFNNLPAHSADVTILRHDDQWLIGRYFLSEREDGIRVEGEFVLPVAPDWPERGE